MLETYIHANNLKNAKETCKRLMISYGAIIIMVGCVISQLGGGPRVVVTSLPFTLEFGVPFPVSAV